MNKLREKGVSLLEPKNKGVLTVNFKHPILKDYKGNGRIITKSLGSDVGKDYEAANKFLNEIKSIINNSDCYENYYGFLKSLEKYSEKSMKIVFDNTHFMEEFYYDFKKSILEKFIGISHNNINKKLEEELKEFSKLLKLEEFELRENSNKSFEIFIREEIRSRFNFEFKKKIQLLGGDYEYRKKLISNLIGSGEKFSEAYKNTNEAKEDKLVNKFFNNIGAPNFEVIFKSDSNKFKFIGTPYSQCIINKKIELKGILEEFLFRINSLHNIFQYKLEFRERKSGKSYVFNNNEFLVKENLLNNKDLNQYSLDNIEDLAYIYFHIGYKDDYKEKSQEELKSKFFYILESLFNEKYNPNNSNLIFSDIRLEGNFRGEEILHNKEKDFILADYSGNINEFRNQLLSYETRRNLASSDEVIWLFNTEEEAFERNLEVLKYLIINGYLNKTNIYIYEKSIYKDYFYHQFDNSESDFISALNEKEAYHMPNIFNSFLKDNFQNLLEELGEEEASIIIRGREEYYLNLIMERVIFTYDEEEKIVSSKDLIEKIIDQSEEVLINRIKEKSSLINEYKPSYKYGRLAILSLGINRKVKREFIRRVRGSYDKNLKEFSLKMAYNFGGREYKSLCPERLLETSIKNSIKTFLLSPYKIRKDINILEFEKSIEYIMESISEEIIEEVEILIREDNLLKWKEAAELLKDDIIEGRNLIEEIIEETFVVSNDIFREDRVLKIIKDVLKNNSIFKAIKGEFAI
ncbi:TPA: hypothetical protein K8N36_002586 [Clostridium perfringens]|uniref:Uncharacterized protein n=1 Tax=Clostridium perfringens TaxID=1502 RepID=A0AB37C4I7_CLOPF|nr:MULTISPECIES: hypothetical protein [Clostridium]AQW25799.1 hypothetical protein BXT94_02975 [Clostridium perfringens]ASY50604.1 hypothetical protein BG908_02685 [Clostridium perfringens]AWS25103.1 hypothetical protein CYK96_05670 [Clostridium perfringens]EGT3618499.1 hypothetical protein [Clostridium perfringens]EGT4141968.1 hypothetical protein [Clostridium perfringens]